MIADLQNLTDDERWQAVASRDRSAAFLFAVKTTSIYCRPGCASRPPRRENVMYFADCDAAERAGYRACKKCRPRERDSLPNAIVQACGLLRRESLSLRALAKAVGLSPSHLQRLFTHHVGVSPKAFATNLRTNRFHDELANAPSVTAAMNQAGYESTSRCYEEIGKRLGMTPTQFRRGGAGVTIQFAVTSCDLGRMLVAGTDRGVCRIEFADTAAELEASLRERFPKAALRPGDATFASWVNEALALVETPAKQSSLPLDIRSTAFQRQVWEALCRIPAGTTATYREIAVAIGRPTAARAVAQACASNPVAVVVPCHRVIGAAGDLRGYRWGVERKRKLLDREGGELK